MHHEINNDNMQIMNYWTEHQVSVLVEHFKTKTYEEIGLMIGRDEQSVRNKAYQMKLRKKADDWTDEQIAILENAYKSASTSEEIRLDDLVQQLGRFKSNICRKARELGLTNQKRKAKLKTKKRLPKYATESERRFAKSESMKAWLAQNGHPKGFFGHKHTDAAKQLISQKSVESNASFTDEQKTNIKIKAAKTKIANGTYAPTRQKTTWKAAWRVIGGKRKFFRSRWEANYARYLEWLKQRGEIVEWQHEKTTFWFDKIKRGCVSYLPDFDVTEKDGSITYHEVKGWMDDRSATKIKRMAKYHPNQTLIVVQAKQYQELERKVGKLIDDWEF